MDWQVIILTLGASLITGAVSLIGNIIVSKTNLKKTLIDNQEQNKKDYLRRRISIYDAILVGLVEIESKLDNEKVLVESELERIWLEDYHYCSKEVNRQLHLFLGSFDRKTDSAIKKVYIKKIREQIKMDLDNYYGIKEKNLKL
ncbi:MAG: hypothetical protein IJF75_05190 [Clostridia bacterium]|nr:hypothetical protein [Clostridia bacterium]